MRGLLVAHQFELADVDRLAVRERDVVGLRQVDIALRLAQRASALIAFNGHDHAADVVVQILDGARHIDAGDEAVEIQRNHLRVTEHHGLVDVTPLQVIGLLGQSGDQRLEQAQFRFDRQVISRV